MDLIVESMPRLLQAAQVTLQLLAGAVALGFVMAVLSGLGRLSRRRAVRAVAGTYIEVFRGTSVLIQLFWFYYALPHLGFALGGPWARWFSLGEVTAGIVALGLNIGAYGGEVVRGAIQAVPKGQTEAAIALNMSPTHRMRRVIFPQALVRMIPPFGNNIIEVLKGTALVSLIALADLTFTAQQIRFRTGETELIFGTILVMYFVLAYVVTIGMRWLERRTARSVGLGRAERAGVS